MTEIAPQRRMPAPEQGDVLVMRSPNGTRTLRTVLRVYRSGRNWGVVLPIRRCSWTKRGYTYVSFNDLRCNGRRIMGIRKGAGRRLLQRPLYRLLLKDIAAACTEKPCIRCCQVAGVIG